MDYKQLFDAQHEYSREKTFETKNQEEMNKTIQEIRSLKKELENKIFELVSEFEAETTVEVPIIYVSHSKLRSTSGELVAKCITIDVQLNYDTAE